MVIAPLMGRAHPDCGHVSERNFLQFGILGPLRVGSHDGGPIAITASRERAVLALLLVHHNRLVTVDEVVDAIWPENPPTTVRAQVKTVMSKLRRQLGDTARAWEQAGAEPLLQTRPTGYVLCVSPQRLDLSRFEELTAETDAHLAAGRHGAAIVALRAALALWRGPALADVTAPFAAPVAHHLALRKLSVVERLVEIELSRGNHQGLVPMLHAMIQEHPLHERLRAQLMLALYRSGQVNAALEVYRAAHRTFTEELGIEPGPELVRLHGSILRRGEAPPGGPSTVDRPTAPRQLPRRPSILVGREQEVRCLDRMLRSAGSPVVALHGPGGVGKSALALRVAHEVADRYPDGQLYLDLRATMGRPPLSPGEALGRFLRALGTPPGEVPASDEEAAALWQSLLNGRRMLLVLDNARDAAQIAALLPAGDGCAALVTSRAVLSTLVCAVRSVDLLSEPDAVRLLAVGAGERRIASQPDAAREVAQACGLLPLALRIAAARIAARPDWSMADLLARLQDPSRRLDELHAADLAVRPSFEAGYASLSDKRAAAAFRLFGVFNVPRISVPMMAVLLDTDTADARHTLDQLVAARLVEPAGQDRFRCHDLLGLYAAELARQTDSPRWRADALRRGLDWYVQASLQIQDLLRPSTRSHRDGPEALGPMDVAQAVRWLEEETPNLMAAAGLAAAADRDLAEALVATAKAAVRRASMRCLPGQADRAVLPPAAASTG